MFRTGKRMLLMAACVQAIGGAFLAVSAREGAWAPAGRLCGFCLIAIPLFVAFVREHPRTRDDFGSGVVRLVILGWMTAGSTLLGIVLGQVVIS